MCLKAFENSMPFAVNTAASARGDSRLTILALGLFAVGTDSFIFAGILPEISREFDISLTTAAQLVTMYAFTYAILTPVLSAATCHYSPTSVLRVGLIIFVLATLALCLSNNFLFALIARSAAGMGAAIFVPTATVVAAAIASPAQKNKMIGIAMLGLSSAAAVGAPAGIFLAPSVGWRVILFSLAILAVIVAIVAGRFLPRIEPARYLSLKQRLQPLRDRRIVLTLCATFIVLTGLYLTYTYASIVFGRVTNHQPTNLAILLAVWGFSATIGSVIGRFADRFGDRTFVNCVLAVLIFNFYFLSQSYLTFEWAVVGIAIWGVCAWAFVVPQQHRLLVVAPHIAPVLIALHLTAVYAGASASGVVGAIALQYIAPEQIALISALLIFCGWVMSELSGAMGKRRLMRRPIIKMLSRTASPCRAHPALGASLKASFALLFTGGYISKFIEGRSASIALSLTHAIAIANLCLRRGGCLDRKTHQQSQRKR